MNQLLIWGQLQGLSSHSPGIVILTCKNASMFKPASILQWSESPINKTKWSCAPWRYHTCYHGRSTSLYMVIQDLVWTNAIVIGTVAKWLITQLHVLKVSCSSVYAGDHFCVFDKSTSHFWPVDCAGSAHVKFDTDILYSHKTSLFTDICLCLGISCYKHIIYSFQIITQVTGMNDLPCPKNMSSGSTSWQNLC